MHEGSFRTNTTSVLIWPQFIEGGDKLTTVCKWGSLIKGTDQKQSLNIQQNLHHFPNNHTGLTSATSTDCCHVWGFFLNKHNISVEISCSKHTKQHTISYCSPVQLDMHNNNQQFELLRRGFYPRWDVIIKWVVIGKLSLEAYPFVQEPLISLCTCTLQNYLISQSKLRTQHVLR
jgi:hypothetical protein